MGDQINSENGRLCEAYSGCDQPASLQVTLRWVGNNNSRQPVTNCFCADHYDRWLDNQYRALAAAQSHRHPKQRKK
jgi:hypothetical protein